MDSETRISFAYSKFNTTSPELEKRRWRGMMGGRKEGRKGRRATERGKEKKIKRRKGEECFSWHVK